MTDRTVHASADGVQVVRYDRGTAPHGDALVDPIGIRPKVDWDEVAKVWSAEVVDSGPLTEESVRRAMLDCEGDE